LHSTVAIHYFDLRNGRRNSPRTGLGGKAAMSLLLRINLALIAVCALGAGQRFLKSGRPLLRLRE
jgi:hypothetical protein